MVYARDQSGAVIHTSEISDPVPLFSISTPLDFMSISYTTEQAGLILATKAMEICENKFGPGKTYHIKTDS